MSMTLEQIYTANPITGNLSTDLMYFSQSPYTKGNDAGMTFSNFSSQFLRPGNNLSDLNNNLTALNNLSLISDFYSIVINGNVTLTNPCPNWIEVGGGVNANLTIQMPVMNSTTPGSKSAAVGERYIIRNLTSSATVTMLDGGGTPILNGAILPGCYIEMVNDNSNGTSPGLFIVNVNKPNYGLTNGQLLIGSTGVAPVATTLTAGTGISIANGAGSITISVSASGDAVVNVTTSTQQMSANTKYIINYAGGLCTLTLPTTFSQGDEFEVIGNSVGGWSVVENSGQNIRIGSLSTTTSSGSLSSANQYDCVKMQGLTANTTLTVTSAQTAGFTIV